MGRNEEKEREIEKEGVREKAEESKKERLFTKT